MASLLFLAPADLGEAVLATGALDHALKSGDTAVIVCDPDARDLFRAVPALEKIIVMPPGAVLSTWWSLVRDGAGGAYCIGAREEAWINYLFAGFGPRLKRRKLSPVLRHRVEEWTELLGADRALAPTLWLDDAARAAASALVPETAPLMVLAPGGNSAAKRWPAERFAAVARRLAGAELAGARIAVIGAAARDAAVTRAIVSSLEADGVEAVDLGRVPDLLAAGALMQRATLSIGNDNALTHIAAAMGAPTLTIFGPTDERVRAPFGPRVRTLRGRSFEAAALSDLDGRAAMEDVSIDAVEAAALELLHAGGITTFR